MSRIKVYGPVGDGTFDEEVASEFFITKPQTWGRFISGVPRKGTCRMFIGHESSNGTGERISGKNLKDYTFEEVCWRVELKPTAG